MYTCVADATTVYVHNTLNVYAVYFMLRTLDKYVLRTHDTFTPGLTLVLGKTMKLGFREEQRRATLEIRMKQFWYYKLSHCQ